MFSILHISYRGRIMMKRDRPERLFVDVLVSMFSSGFSIVPRIILSLSLPRYRSSMRKYRDEIVDIDIQCVSGNTWRTFGVRVSYSRSFSRWFSTLLSYIRNLLEYPCLRFEICSIIQQECEKGMFEDIIAPLDGYENSGFDTIELRTNFIRDFGICNSRTSSVRSYDEEDWIVEHRFLANAPLFSERAMPRVSICYCVSSIMDTRKFCNMKSIQIHTHTCIHT